MADSTRVTRMKSGFFLSAAVVLALSLSGSSASAALTSSEKGQIKDFITAAKVENAAQVRSLVARTDLTPDEAAGALSDAIGPLAWSDAKGAFLRELVMNGPTSTRSPLAVAATKALLARADNVFQHEQDKLEKDRSAVAELVALYAWLDTNIANAGTPTAAAHDANAGLTPATYEECSKLLKDHVEKNSKWLKGDGALPDSTARVRAQAQATLLDMMPDGLTRRVEAADRLGLKGARKQMLTDWGVLYEDAGKLDEAKVEKVRQTLVRMAGARSELELVFYGPTDHRQGLRARGAVAHVVGGNDRYPFDGDAPGTWDPGVGTITHDLSVIAAAHAMKSSAALKSQVEKDVAASSSDPGRVLGRPRAPSAEYILGAAINAVMTDAQRAIDLCVTRFNGGQPQTAALLSDAVAALAAYAPEESKKAATANPKIEVGKSGASAFAPMTNIKKGPSDTTASFTLDGHTWNIDRQGAANAVVGIRRDGAAASSPKVAAPAVAVGSPAPAGKPSTPPKK